MNEVVSLAASDRLRVVFERRGDRWAHRIEWRSPEGERVDWESVEGSSDDIWPPSPPFQSLELQSLPDGRQIAFLVGMAGSSHWSAAVEARCKPEEIHFDIACRCSTPPASLGSEYRIAAPPAVSHVNAGRHFSLRGPKDGHCTSLICNDQNIAIRVEPGPAPGTMRWCYVVARAPD
jgi:hypothetical protein